MKSVGVHFLPLETNIMQTGARQPKNGHMAVGEWTSGNVGWDGSQISLRRGRLAQGFRSAVPRANAVPGLGRDAS